jgi:hypothetical protein
VVSSSLDEWPGAGEVVVDRRDGRVGEVRSSTGRSSVRLRPLGGGHSWLAAPSDVRRATPAERLRARVSAANARSRRPRPESGG